MRRPFYIDISPNITILHTNQACFIAHKSLLTNWPFGHMEGR